MTLLPNESILYRHRSGTVVTSHRVFSGDLKSDYFVSIMLEQICSVEMVGQHLSRLLVAAFVSLGLAAALAYGAMRTQDMLSFFALQRWGFICAGLFVVFLLLWAWFRQRTLSIASAGACILVRGVRVTEFAELIESMEAAKNRRMMLLSGSAVSEAQAHGS